MSYVLVMAIPSFEEDEVDYSDDETGYSWDCDREYPIENGEEDA